MEIDNFLEEASIAKRKLDEAQAEYDAAIAPVKDYVAANGETVAGFGVRVSRTKASVSTSIDLKKLQSAEPELYDDLLRDYPKRTERKATVRVTFGGC